MASDIRPLESFDQRSQQALQNGQTVVAGDGRRFTFINGQAVVENGDSFRNMVQAANGPNAGFLAGRVDFQPNGQVSQDAPGRPQATYDPPGSAGPVKTSGGSAPVTGGTASSDMATGNPGSLPFGNGQNPTFAGGATLPGAGPEVGMTGAAGAPAPVATQAAAAPAPAAAPFDPMQDPEYASAIARLDAVLGNSRADYDAGSTSTRTRFARMLRDAGQKLPGDLENSTEAAAGRGMLRSGGFLEDQGRIRKGFADYNAQIGEDQTSELNDLLRSFTATSNDVGAQKQEAMAAAARRRAEAQANAPAQAGGVAPVANAVAPQQAVAPITATPGPAQQQVPAMSGTPGVQTPDAQGYSYTSPVAPYVEPNPGLSDGWYNLLQTNKLTGQVIPGAKTHRQLLDEGLAASAAELAARKLARR